MGNVTRRRILAQALLPLCGLTACGSQMQPAAEAVTVMPAQTTQVATIPAKTTGTAAPRVTFSAGSPVIGVNVDAAQRLHPINPLIYGLAGGSDGLKAQIRPTLARWGGNPSSRYNWRLGNAWNAGRDWQFRNGNYGNASASDRLPSGVADSAILANRAQGAATLLTIPALGWVAKDDNNASQSLGVPSTGGPALPGRTDGIIAGYDPTPNRQRTSVPSAARSSTSTDLGAVVQSDWVRHLVGTFGDAAHGGVQYYAIDNEPDIWDGTHTDVHPARPGYDDMLAMFLDYASMIKEADPTAQVTGPVLSGWTGFYYSALDRGTDNFKTAKDRAAHGGAPFLPWWLTQLYRHDRNTGQRTLDVLDVHWYPQGGEYTAGGTDPAMNARRLRSTRSLWDPTYIDESWIGKTWDENVTRGVVRLIPRLRDWVSAYYPGTKIAISEWNWGADDTPNGALTIAEVLGIFGREGLDMAAYWTAPKERSPGALAFAAYRNYDGRGGQFGAVALAAATTAPDQLSCFAALDPPTGDVTAIMVNKAPQQPANVSFQISNFPSGAISVYQCADAMTAWRPLAPMTLQDNGVEQTLPPSSITVWRLGRQ